MLNWTETKYAYSHASALSGLIQVTVGYEKSVWRVTITGYKTIHLKPEFKSESEAKKFAEGQINALIKKACGG